MYIYIYNAKTTARAYFLLSPGILYLILINTIVFSCIIITARSIIIVGVSSPVTQQQARHCSPP